MASKGFTDEQKRFIIEAYANHTPVKDIADKLGVWNNSITRFLRKNDIERNQLKRIPEETIQTIIARYGQGISSEVIAKDLGINGSTVCRQLKKHGIEIRPATENKRRYKINENYFETIDIEEKAYFLGFLYADGSLGSDSNNIRIVLHHQDIDVLQKWSVTIYGFEKIQWDTGNNRLVPFVDVFSQKMHTDLCALGCTPQKSFTIKFPDFLQGDLLRHFIRGYFDGDGCICLTDKARPRIDITSNQEFLEGLIEYLTKRLGITFGKLGRRHKDRETTTRNIQVSGFTNVKKFLDYLYRDATIFMNRKKELYGQFLVLWAKKQQDTNHKASDITRYGTTYIPEFNGKRLTKEVVGAMHQEERDETAKFLLSFYRERGFPYPTLTNEELLHEFLMLKNTDPNAILDGNIIRPFNNVGVSIFKHFSPHYYEVNERGHRSSLLNTFNDDTRLLKVIHNRFTQDGGYNMTGNMLKQGLCNSKVGYKASIFFPLVAKLVYSRHLKDGDIAYDYSMGFGQRLLGFLSLPFSGVYIGVDPVEKTVESNRSIFNFYNERISGLNKTVDLICSGSENYTGEKYAGRVSLAFSSPPYFDLERYEDSDAQAYSKGYISFISSWWKDTVAHITRMLKPGGLFILNVKDQYEQLNLGSDMTELIEKAGYNRLEGYKMQITRNTRYLRKDGQHKYEPFYVFQKPA